MTWKALLLALPLLIISCGSGDPPVCYSPTQGNGSPYSKRDGEVGCPCVEGQDKGVCVMDRGPPFGLLCFEGRWIALHDFACVPSPPPPDAGPDMSSAADLASGFCATCAADELCVVFHDGPCGAHPTCKKKTATCAAATCDDACNHDMCGGATCHGPACPETALYPTALHCYGS